MRNNKQIPNEEAPLMSFTSTGGIEAKGDRYNREFLVKDKNKMYKKTELYDLIYSSNNLDVGAIGLNRYGEAVISDVYEIFSIKSSFSPYYVELAIIQPKFINNILKFRQGALYGQYRIHAKDFLKLKIKLPYELEQQKIGDFFNKLDQLIEKQSHKVDLLKQRKKGLLQKMFV
ncbi:restriction endonuclease subunit S [Staphylococcus delphini]|uniref:restriction endonuclease subunit S n=1 Tax=Staphylococcus delphini TaxID=53344 RepID=UPI0039C8FCC3